MGIAKDSVNAFLNNVKVHPKFLSILSFLKFKRNYNKFKTELATLLTNAEDGADKAGDGDITNIAYGDLLIYILRAMKNLRLMKPVYDSKSRISSVFSVWTTQKNPLNLIGTDKKRKTISLSETIGSEKSWLVIDFNKNQNPKPNTNTDTDTVDEGITYTLGIINRDMEYFEAVIKSPKRLTVGELYKQSITTDNGTQVSLRDICARYIVSYSLVNDSLKYLKDNHTVPLLNEKHGIDILIYNPNVQFKDREKETYAKIKSVIFSKDRISDKQSTVNDVFVK
ncbi:MAG: hypothetical protein NkDv07_0103 [Candidatus Improbicoccus devescovinae]|nr:MAG: hypothetical protein NkDv07_0103 [Candidatus Improbicoccus devescovinae]